MRRLIIFCLILTLFFAIPGYALQNGQYCGEFLMSVDNPTQCAPNNPGSVIITDLGGNYILLEHVLGELTCKITGSAIHCPPTDQVIDFTQWGLNAIVTNKASNGVGVILSDTGFRINYSVRRNTCDGADCDLVGQWMGVNFPCNIGPWISAYNLCE